MEDEEVNPFLSLDANALADDANAPPRRGKPRTARDWGIPTFSDQIDRKITSYRLCDSVTVHLEHRLHSTGSDLWDSSLVMAHAIGNWIPDMSGWHVVELGSGTGAVGLYCSKALGAHVVLTDLRDNLALLERNRAENGLELDVDIAALDWTADVLPEVVARGGQGVDLILGSDLCKCRKDSLFRRFKSLLIHLLFSFFPIISRPTVLPFAPNLLDPLAKTLHSIMLLRADKPDLAPTKAFLVYEERFDCSGFFRAARTYGMLVAKVDRRLLHPKYQDPDRIHVLEVSLSRVGQVCGELVRLPDRGLFCLCSQTIDFFPANDAPIRRLPVGDKMLLLTLQHVSTIFMNYLMLKIH